MTTHVSIETTNVAAFFHVLTKKLWNDTARKSQQCPSGKWTIWLILAGRGWGKTRTGAQDAALYGMQNPGSRIAIVAPTFADARDTCVEGESGIFNILGPAIQTWNRSYGEIVLTNGTRYKLFSADEPERLRGPQHHRAWCDELAAWTRPEAFDQLAFGLRLKGPKGTRPQIVATTTPRPTAFLKALVQRRDVRVTRGSTYENAAHLAASALAGFEERYRGTRLGRQELEAEILEDADAALFRRATIDRHRVAAAPPLVRVVVALDPAVTSKAGSDLTGIVCAGIDARGHAYVLADATGRYPPDGWAAAARALAQAHGASLLVGETNQGGDMIARVLAATATDGARLAYKGVRAATGKIGRALPIAAYYEQGRVHHVCSLAPLEDQLCRLTLQGYEAADGRDDSEKSPARSPDRADALVWALTELLVTNHGSPGLQVL